VNDRLLHADIWIATSLVLFGTALTAYPWLGGIAFATLPLGLLVAGVIALALGARREVPKAVSGQIPWT